MGFWDSGGNAPTPPNPIVTAAAQTSTNVGTALANSYLGNVNQVTPQGSLTNQVTGNYNFVDPASGASYNIPRWTTTQTLSPVGQQAFDTGQQTQLNLARMGQQQSAALGGLLSTPFNPNDSAPAAGDINWLHSAPGPTTSITTTPGYQTYYGGGGNIQDAYGLGGDITRSYGPTDNFSADRSRIEQGLMDRLNPQLALENERVRQQLSDQGIRQGYGQGGWVGRDAYTNAMDVYNRQADDARLAVIGQAGQEQQRENQMAQAQAAFQNAAQAQANQQNAALAQFGNQAQAQREAQNAAHAAFFNQGSAALFAEQAARNQFYNQAANQILNRNQNIFNAQNQLRSQALSEAYQQRAQPINEITSLMSGSQVAQPNWANVARTQIPTTDVAGLINQNFAQQNDLFKTSMQSWNDIMGGILGFGGQAARAGIPMMSDRRVKEDIEPMGSVLGNGKKLPIYEYQFKGDPDGNRHVGPMAQDVERLDPDAVTEIGGVKHIRPDKLGSIFGRAA